MLRCSLMHRQLLRMIVPKVLLFLIYIVLICVFQAFCLTLFFLLYGVYIVLICVFLTVYLTLFLLLYGVCIILICVFQCVYLTLFLLVYGVWLENCAIGGG